MTLKTRLPSAIFCLVLVATLGITPPLQVYATYQITEESFPDRARTFAEVAGCQLGVIIGYYVFSLVIDQTAGKDKPEGENPVEKTVWQSVKDALAEKFSREGLKKIAQEALLKAASKGAHFGISALMDEAGLPKWAKTLFDILFVAVSALIIASILTSGPLAFGMAEALKFGLFILTTFGLSNCGPIIHKDFTEKELGGQNEFIKVLTDGFDTNIGSITYERKLEAPGNPNFLTKDNNYSDCGVIMVYPQESVHAFNDYSFGSFNTKNPSEEAGQQFVDFTWAPGDWANILYLNTLFDTDLNEAKTYGDNVYGEDKHPLIERFATITDTGDLYEFNSKLTDVDKAEVEKERTKIYGKSKHSVLDVFLVKLGESQVNFASTTWASISAKWTRNLIPYTITVTEEIDPHIKPGPDHPLEAFFPTGTIVPPGFEQMLIDEATAKDDCTDQKDLKITTNFLDQLNPDTGQLELGTHEITLFTEDQNGNEATATLYVKVADTISPDIHPVENVGVMLDKHENTISGQVLLGGDYPNTGDEPLLEEPITFDLGTLLPTANCHITDTSDECKNFVFPLGETDITWEIADRADPPNNSIVTQEVHVRNTANTAPQAIPDSLLVATGFETEILIHGEDADHDKLSFFVTENPSLGEFSSDIDATFQNRYSIAGQIKDMSQFETQTRKGVSAQSYSLPNNLKIQEKMLEVEHTDKSILRIKNGPNVLGIVDLSMFGTIVDVINKQEVVVEKTHEIEEDHRRCNDKNGKGDQTLRRGTVGFSKYIDLGMRYPYTCEIPRTQWNAQKSDKDFDEMDRTCRGTEHWGSGATKTSTKENRERACKVAWDRGYCLCKDPQDLYGTTVIKDQDALDIKLIDKTTASPLDKWTGGKIFGKFEKTDPFFNYQVQQPDEKITLVPQPDKNRVIIFGSTDGLIKILKDLYYQGEKIRPDVIVAVDNHFWDSSRDSGGNKNENSYIVFDWKASRVYELNYNSDKKNYSIGQGQAYNLKKVMEKLKKPQDVAVQFFKDSEFIEKMYILDNDDGKFALWQVDWWYGKYIPNIIQKINPTGFASWSNANLSIELMESGDVLIANWGDRILINQGKISGGDYNKQLNEVARWELTHMLHADTDRLYDPKGFKYQGKNGNNILIDIGDSGAADTQFVELVYKQTPNKHTKNEIGANFVKISALDADSNGKLYLGDRFGLSKFNIRGDIEKHSLDNEAIIDVVVGKNSVFTIEREYDFQSKLLQKWDYFIKQYDKDLTLVDIFPINYRHDILYAGKPFSQDWSYVSRLAYDPANEKLAYVTLDGVYTLNLSSESDLEKNPVKIKGQPPVNKSNKANLTIDIDFDSNGYFYTLENWGKVSKFAINPDNSLNLMTSYFVKEPLNESAQVIAYAPNTNPQKISIDHLDNLYVIEPKKSGFDIPRIQKYSKSLEFVAYAEPHGTPGQLKTFLTKGEFLDIQDVAFTLDTMFVAEKGQLQRVHFFESPPFSNVDPTTAKVIYKSDETGTTSFKFIVADLFVSSEPVVVNIEVRDDTEPPLITSELDIANTITSNDDSINGHEMMSNIRAIKPYLEKRTTVQYLSLYDSENLTPLLQETLKKYSTEDSASENKDNLIDLVEISTAIQIKNGGSCPSPLYVEADTKDPDNVLSQGGTLPTNADIQYYLDSIIAIDDFDKEPDIKKILYMNILDDVGTPLADDPTIYPVGENLVKVTAKDDFGNESTCRLEIIVQDTTPPTIESPETFVTPVEGVLTKVTVNDILTPEVFDAIDSSPVLTNDLSEEGYPVGHNVLTWTATDSSGNSVNATQVIFIEDNQVPSIPSQDPIIAYAVNGYSNKVDFTIPEATDLGGILQQTECSPSLEDATLSIGTIVILCSAMDNARLSSMITIPVHVIAKDTKFNDGIGDIIGTQNRYEFSDEQLGGTTFGKITKTLNIKFEECTFSSEPVCVPQKVGPCQMTFEITEHCTPATKEANNLIIIDSPEESLGVNIIAKPESKGINDDGDNKTDEDPYNGIDDDGDGFIGEDDNAEYQGQTQEVTACKDDQVILKMDESDLVSLTCSGTIRIGGLGGEPITLLKSSDGYFGFVIPFNNVMYYDSNQVRPDSENTHEIIVFEGPDRESVEIQIENSDEPYTLKPES